MPGFLSEHLEGCRPLKPCSNCETVMWLRGKLKPSDFAELLQRLEGKLPETGTTRLQVPLESKFEDALPEISTRLRAALKNENCVTIADIVKLSEADVMNIPNIARVSTDELIAALARLGYQLRVE